MINANNGIRLFISGHVLLAPVMMRCGETNRAGSEIQIQWHTSVLLWALGHVPCEHLANHSLAPRPSTRGAGMIADNRMMAYQGFCQARP